MHGSGCPQAGSIPADGALFLRLTPPGASAGNAWGADYFSRKVVVFSSKAYKVGESDVTVVPQDNGRFVASIRVPDDAPAGEGYTVRAICTTVLALDPNTGRFTPSSGSASQAQAGYLDVG